MNRHARCMRNSRHRIMFPTRVGMNRPAITHGVQMDVPHASGDEPYLAQDPAPRRTMFPTRVGMNQGVSGDNIAFFYVPHASGDEPATASQAFEMLHVPHASGDELNRGHA